MVIAPKIQFDDENSIQNSRIQYQQLHLRDLWQRVQMPQEIIAQLMKVLVFQAEEIHVKEVLCTWGIE